MITPDLTHAEKLIHKCQCGEPIIAGRILCDACVKLCNERAMATMKTVIGALGTNSGPESCAVCNETGGSFVRCYDCDARIHICCGKYHVCPDEVEEENPERFYAGCGKELAEYEVKCRNCAR